MYHRPPGYYQRAWHRGDRLPAAYYQRSYVIADYRDCGLRAPPRGYQWVRVNGDAVLAGIATGIVLESVFHIFG
jgi:Ni/Co efflux regulator RcnB